MLVTYEEGLKLIEKPYGEIKRYYHETDCRPGAVLLLGPLIITARGANVITCKIGEADEYI